MAGAPALSYAPGWYGEHYPGDQYVDWHAFDFYVVAGDAGASTCTPFDDSFLAELSAQASDKPVMMVEFGVAASAPCGDRVGWFRDFFDATTKKYAALAAFLYWQDVTPPFDTRIEASDPVAGALRNELESRPALWPGCVALSDSSNLCPSGVVSP